MDITLDFDCFYLGGAFNPYKRPKSVILGNLSKNACVWATQWATFSLTLH